MNYYIIAGEASGDLHASNLMKELNKRDAAADFRCWGGDLMEEQGGMLVKHYRDLAFMGFLEVLLNIRTILRNMRFCKKDILVYKPDVLILVDYPGFNLRIAKFAAEQGIRVFYYISPQVWAWKKSRVFKIRKYVERMFVILPFEKDFYSKYDYEVDFVGHPLLDAIGVETKDNDDLRDTAGLDDRPVIAVLPGSRKQEIRKMLPVMKEMAGQFPDHQFVIAAAPSTPDQIYLDVIKDTDLKLVRGRMHDLLRISTAAMVTSGTATLETALFRVPEVVCYKGGWISYLIARRLVKDIEYISLVNLIMDHEVVKELIQGDFNTKNLKKELALLITDEAYRAKMLSELDALQNKLGGPGASEMAAGLMYQRLVNKE
ncbi:MAG: lipid-A-disaccharide synthase [Bacteroidetes bacterium]|nr:lipid-A-disaccharide synthase [Bacteroidota bacterium]